MRVVLAYAKVETIEYGRHTLICIPTFALTAR